MTAAQNRLLHRVAAHRGLTHDDLRAAAGVQSLSLLSDSAAAALIDRLRGQDARQDVHARRGRGRRLRAGELRCAHDASTAQRRTVARLLSLTGWPAAKARGWLLRRHRVRDLAGEPIASWVLVQAIVQLERVLDKHAPGWRAAAADPAVVESLLLKEEDHAATP